MHDGATRRNLAAIAAGVLAMTMGTGLASAQTDSVLLPGYVYDFHSSHPDFALTSGSGLEVTGLLDIVLGSDNRPVLMGPGLALTDQALDAAGEGIAPHLYSPFDPSGGPLVLENAPSRNGNNVLDTYDPNAGYDASTATSVGENVPTVPGIENITPPPFDESVTKVTAITYKNEFSGFDISGTFHCDNFTMRQSVMNVVADTVIRVDNAMVIRTSSEIHIAPGATLTFWLGGSASVENQCYLNMNGDHTQLIFNNFGTGTFILENYSSMTASYVAPNGAFLCQNNTEFFGAITAADLSLENSTGVHLAGEIVVPSTCFAQGDTQMAAGSSDDGRIASGLSFAQWFGPAPGINLSQIHQIWLNPSGSGYRMSVADWDPINDELYGNEGGATNRGFTFAGESLFEFESCTGQYFDLTTSMDAWVFVDDILVIDMGGSTGSSSQRIEMDRMGLEAGLHRLRVFLAQRVDDVSELEIETTIKLTTPRGITFRATAFHD